MPQAAEKNVYRIDMFGSPSDAHYRTPPEIMDQNFRTQAADKLLPIVLDILLKEGCLSDISIKKGCLPFENRLLDYIFLITTPEVVAKVQPHLVDLDISDWYFDFRITPHQF